MKRMLVLAAAAAVAATAAVSGQNGSGLDAPTLKGLELRSLGPALATGRIQDVEIDPKNPQLSGTSRRRSADCGKRPTAASPSPRFSTTRAPSPSAASSSIRRTPTWSGSGRARTRASAARISATASTSPPTPARPGRSVGLDASEHIGKIVDRSAQLERRLRRRAGAALVGRRRARPVQDDRRRRDVERRADDQPGHGRQRRRVRCQEPRHHLRVVVPAPSRRRTDDWRRPRGRHFQDDRTPARPGRS